MSDLLDLAPKTSATTAPKRQWRNLWHSIVGWEPVCFKCGGDHRVEGTNHWWGCTLHDTKDAAARDAERQLAERRVTTVTWLGAYPAEGGGA